LSFLRRLKCTATDCRVLNYPPLLELGRLRVSYRTSAGGPLSVQNGFSAHESLGQFGYSLAPASALVLDLFVGLADGDWAVMVSPWVTTIPFAMHFPFYLTFIEDFSEFTGAVRESYNQTDLLI